LIQRARQEDIPQIIGMLSDLHSESPEYGSAPRNKRYVENSLKSMLYNDTVIFLVYTDKDTGEIKGFILAAIVQDWFAPTVTVYEQLLYVKPAHRGTLTAPRLVQSLERYALAAGATKVRAGATTGINHSKALSLYERMGYADLGTLVQKRIGG
jgi:GNAT superfamily N-acetyltransferase